MYTIVHWCIGLSQKCIDAQDCVKMYGNRRYYRYRPRGYGYRRRRGKRRYYWLWFLSWFTVLMQVRRCTSLTATGLTMSVILVCISGILLGPFPEILRLLSLSPPAFGRGGSPSITWTVILPTGTLTTTLTKTIYEVKIWQLILQLQVIRKS